jgi:anti-anti-sigma factor
LSIQTRKKGRALLVTIKDEMTIYTAAQQKEELLGYMESNQELEMNLAGVSEIDSAGLQILLLLKQEAEQNAKEIRLLNHSQAVTELFEMLDLTGRFGDPVATAAG